MNKVPTRSVQTTVSHEKPLHLGAKRDVSIATATARQRALQSTTTSIPSIWHSNFCDCWCSVAPTYCCSVTCCPCMTFALVKESLGGSYEWTLLYFGVLFIGSLVSLGLAVCNSSNGPLHDVKTALFSPVSGPHAKELSFSAIWEGISAVLLMVLLFGVWQLRTQTRLTLGIQGSHVFDCVTSFCCCFCVISQLHLELKCQYSEESPLQGRRNRRAYNVTTTGPVDTLAPYAVM